MKLKLIEKKPETSDAVSFRFEPAESLTWQAGQFMKYTLDHPQPDERKIQRFFTNAAAPHEGWVQITTRFAPEHGSSFKAALSRLEPGVVIEATGPSGSFVVDKPGHDFVFIAGGIGITPYRSILLDLDHRDQPINVRLLYSNRTPEFVFKGELDQLAAKHPSFQVHYLVDPERVDEATIGRLVPDLTKPIFYTSGPEPMVEAVEKLLADLGIPDERSIRDYFPGYQWP